MWKRDFLGASGLFSVVLKPVSKNAVAAMLDGLKLFGMGFSWGGYESLVIPFDAKSYRTATKWEAEGPALRLQSGSRTSTICAPTSKPASSASTPQSKRTLDDVCRGLRGWLLR